MFLCSLNIPFHDSLAKERGSSKSLPLDAAGGVSVSQQTQVILLNIDIDLLIRLVVSLAVRF